MDDKLDNILYKHMPEVETRYIDRLDMANRKEHLFSTMFEKKMKKWMEQKKAYAYYRRIVAAVLLCICISAIGVLSVEASREALWEFVTNVRERFTEIIFFNERSDDERYEKLDFSYPVPSNYRVVEEVMDTDVSYVFLEDVENRTLMYERYNATNFKAYLDTEGIETEQSIYKKVIIEYFSNKGIDQAYWSKGKVWYHIEADASELDIVELARDMIDAN